MLEKNFLSLYSLNFTILLLLSVIISVKSANKCKNTDMDYNELTYDDFNQCDGYIPKYYSGSHIFFSKLYYNGYYRGWRSSYGHLNKQIDFKRDFHLRLRNNPYYYPVDYFSFFPFNYGLAIVLGPHKSDSYRTNYLGLYFLIQGLKDSIVIIFSNDARKAYILDCQESPCNIFDTPADEHEFNELRQNNIMDVHVLYYASKNLIKVYKNDYNYESNLLVSFNDVHLTKYTKNTRGKGYIGFTSSDYYGQYFNDLLETYYCTNGGDKITPTVTVTYDKTTINHKGQIIVPPFETYTLKVKYNSYTDAELMGPGEIYFNEIFIPDYYYDFKDLTYIYNLNTDNNYGTYKLKYKTEYDTFEFTIIVQSNEITQLKYAYALYPDEKQSYEMINDIRYLTFGTLDGIFDYSILEGNYLYFYVIPEDEYNHKCDIIDSTKIKKEFIDKFNLEITLEKVEGDEHIYKLGIPISRKGYYYIPIFYFDFPIAFDVINLIPSVEKSSCKLEIYPQNIYNRDQDITYFCTFKDKDNDEINIQNAQKYKNLIIKTYLNRNDVFLKDIQGDCSGSKCTYIYKTSFNGKYKFETKIGFGENLSNIETSPNIFNVSPEPLTLKGSFFYSFYEGRFIPFDSADEEKFYYNEDDEDNENILLIDLVDNDSEGKEITRYSDIEYPYENFDPTKIKGKILEEHSKYEGELTLEKTTFKGKEYILAKLDNSQPKMKRSSIQYTINLTFDLEKNLTLQYILPNLGEYTACGRNLQINNSIIKTIYPNPIQAGNSGIIAQLVLRTDEEHLHNYFLPDINKITFTEENYNCYEKKTCEINALKSDIEGIYNLQFKTNKTGDYKVIVKVGEDNLQEGNNFFSVNVKPVSQAYSIEQIIPYETKYRIGEEDVKLGFKLKDIYDNPINAEMTGDYFGLLVEITINNEESETPIIKYEHEEDCYYIKESIVKSGNYLLTLKSKYSDEKIEYKYYKGPGNANFHFSSLKVINTNKLNLHEEAKAELYLYDLYKNSINDDPEIYEKEIQNVEIYALNVYNQRVSYRKDEDNKFITDPLNITGTYHIYGKVYGNNIECLSPLFEVVDYGYDFATSQLKMIGETTIIMKKDNNYILYEGLQRPAFEFDFMTEDGSPSNEIDQKNTIISASLINSNNEPKELDTIWIDVNKLLWVLKDEYDLTKGKYTLEVANNNTIYNYYITIVEYGEDTSKDNIDITNTFVSPNILYLKAGISGSFIVELRDSNSLRYNQALNVNLLECETSDLNINKKEGNKNGQIIVEVKSNKVFSYSEKHKISLNYNGDKINTEVYVVVSAGELHRFEVDSSSVKNETNYILNPGTAGTSKKINLIPYDEFGNKITDSIFNKKIYPEESFSKLFNLRNENNEYSPSLTSSTNPVSHIVELSLFSEKTGTLTLSSIYLPKEYTIEIKAGEPSKYSTGYLDGKPGKTIAGENRTFIIEPKDENGNIIEDNEVIDNIIDKFIIKIYDLDGNLIEDEIIRIHDKDNNRIEYIINNKKAVTKEVKVYYNGDEIIINNNVIYVVNGKAVLDNTILKYNEQESKISDSITISLATLPIIDLQLNDEFGNQVEVLPIINDIEFYLINGDNKLSYNLPYNKNLRLYINDSNVDDYFKIDKLQNDCKLIVKLGEEEKVIKVIFVDSAPTEDKDEPVSFIMDTEDLVLKAGEKGIISLAFYTEKGKPMGYYFNPISQISLSCDSGKEIESEILLGKNYGTYNIIISSIHDINVICTISAIEKTQNFNLKVIPNKVNNCKLSSESIPEAVAGELYVLKFKCFDKYGNDAHLLDGEFGALVTDKDGQNIEYNVNLEEKNEYNLYILPKKSGIYKINSIYFDDEITFDTLPGEISPENSYLEINDKANAGDEIEINIHVLDKYGNIVDLDESQKSIFDLYYRYKEDSIYTKYEKIDITPEIDQNKFKYKKEVNKGGYNEFRGIHHDSSYIIKCKNCEIEVNPGEFNLDKSDVYKFNSFSKTYTKLSKYEDVLYNHEENLFIKIYPKDAYENKISAKNLSPEVKIGDYSLLKTDSNEEYIEFQETENFKKLNGENKLIINYNGNNVVYNVYIAGKDDFDGEDVNPSYTKLLETNLEFTAGQQGFFSFELRNNNNARYNKKFTGNISIEKTDSNVKFHIYNQLSSVILVVVQSEKSNTFPNEGESKLIVSVNSEEVFNLELIINPADLSTAELFAEDIEDNRLKAKADEELRFSIIGKDEYGNLVVINQNEVNLKVKNINNQNEVSYKSSYTDLSNGQQKYVYDLTIVGTYEISSGQNGKKEDLFNTIYKVDVEPGELSPEKTIIRIDSTIAAGNKATATIYPKDKNNNDVDIDDILLGKFFAYILSNKYDFITPDVEKSTEKSFIYESQIDKIGTYQFNIIYNGRRIKIGKVVVNPSICNLDNTLIYFKDKNGQYVKYTEDINAYSSISSPLRLSLVFRDNYYNIISNIIGISISKAYLHGNNMKELYWTYSNEELYLDLLNSENKKILEHLVTRTGKDGYTFTFDINYYYSTQKAQFDVKVSHFGKKEDESDYGNGDYVLDRCNVSTTRAEFMAGTSFEVLLYIRNEDGLLYNGDFSLDNINCDELIGKDDTFRYIKSKKDTGIYSIRYYSQKYKTEEDGIYNVIKLFNQDQSDSTKFNILIINTNGIPYKKNTKITKTLPAKVKQDTTSVSIGFILVDEFGNTIESDSIIKNLSFENNDILIPSQIKFNQNTKEFTADLTVFYPPKNILIQLYYSTDNDKIELFDELQKSEFEFTVDYTKTVVISKNINRMKAGEFLDLNIITYDKSSQCYTDGDLSEYFFITVQGPLEKTIEKKIYNFEKAEGTNCDFIYKIVINENTYYYESGTYSIVVNVNGNNYATYTQTVISGDIDENNFVIYYLDMDGKSYNDQNIPVGETIHFMVQAYDKFNNKIDHESLPSNLFDIYVEPKLEENKIIKLNGGSGALSCSFSTTKIGSYKFDYSYNNNIININNNKGPSSINYVSGDCSPEHPQVDYPFENETDVSIVYKYTIKCLDKYGNEVSKGGAKFSSEVSLYIEESQSKIDIEPKIVDKENGIYEISFIPPLLGGYSIYTYLDGNKYSELQFNLTGKTCDKEYTCPNDGRCVDDLRDCIPEENKCPYEDQKIDKPFRCKEDPEKCVDSMTKCEAPTGSKKCGYMGALIPKDKDYLCSYNLPLDCKRKYPSYRIFCDDGICRTSKALQPNQRVCPIGKVLCADLTCKDSVSECYNDWPECGITQIRCPDQSCVDDQKNCPTTITCSNPDHFVCPDGTCVVNEIYCSRIKTCPDEIPYLCSDNSCATKPESCPHSVACGHGKSLCSDLICRETC